MHPRIQNLLPSHPRAQGHKDLAGPPPHAYVLLWFDSFRSAFDLSDSRKDWLSTWGVAVLSTKYIISKYDGITISFHLNWQLLKPPKPCRYHSQSRTFTRMRGRMVIRWKAWSATKNTLWNIWSATIGWFLNAGAKWSNKIPEYPVSSPKQGLVSERTSNFNHDLYLFRSLQP